MALFMKQDFTPPVLSKKWFAIKLRPNVVLSSVDHIVSILESGLLFREDSAEVEQAAPAPLDVWLAAGGVQGGWFTKGERVASTLAVATCIALYPPRGLDRPTLLRMSAVSLVPGLVRCWHRARVRSYAVALRSLLARQRDYLALARRAAACLKECRALKGELESVSSALQSCRALLCRQQRALSVLLARASSALLGNAPWLPADLPWDAVEGGETDLMKIHHAFLVIQSTLLKHIAMAHYVPSRQAQRLYKNHNERLYWLHTVLIPHLNDEYKLNYEALERMYRLLKNYGNLDVNIVKKPGFAINDTWLYSEVHNGVARSCLELKGLLSKCVNLDTFLDSCALNKQEIDLDVLNRDLDDLIDGISKCLSTMQGSQLRLKKMQYKVGAKVTKEAENNNADGREEVADDVRILKIEDKEPETRDEVFYFVKTEDEDPKGVQPMADVVTAPGKSERDATKIVLSELKRKLVQREDLMRERERQALAKTMPELRDNLPEFPRQMPAEATEKRGFITKIKRQKKLPKKRPHFKRGRKGEWTLVTKKSFVLSPKAQVNESEEEANYEAKISLKNKLKSLLTVRPISRTKLQITKLFRRSPVTGKASENFKYKTRSVSSISNDDVGFENLFDTDEAHNKTTNEATNKAKNETFDETINKVKNEVPNKTTKEALNKVTNEALNKTTNEATNKRPNEVKKRYKIRKSTKQFYGLPATSSTDSDSDSDEPKLAKRSELTTYSDSDSDSEGYRSNLQLLKDIRRHRASRKKNYPSKNGSSYQEDESLKPVEYSFGTGMAMASVLQIGKGKRPALSLEEEYVGNGEVSDDSGNDAESVN